MRFAIVYSKKDVAGINIIKQFKKLGFAPDMPIIELKKESIYSEDLNLINYPKLRGIDFIVFATKHKSNKGESSLTLHAPGNWRGADYGGQPGKACSTSALVLKYLFKQLNRHARKLNHYHVTLECTHHGPLIELPCCFIELGSSEKQWKDEKAAEEIAKTILSLQNYKPNPKYIPVIGIGGPHYCPSFNKAQLNSKYAISHIIPKYSLPLTESMLKQAEQKTLEHVKEVIIDWKGLGKSEKRKQVIDLITSAGLKYKRTKEIEK